MREIDCERNVLEKTRVDLGGGKYVYVTLYSHFDIDQMIDCTPLSENEQTQHVSGAAFKSMSVRFSKYKISESMHEYVLSFGFGATESKKRKVIKNFEERLGKVQRIESHEPQLLPDTDEIVGYLWKVPVV